MARTSGCAHDRLVPLYAVLFVSGLAALGAEVVWARIAHRLLGSTALSVACVVAGFLAGLGLGAKAAESFLPRPARPLRAYAMAELAALAALLLFPLVAEAARPALALAAGDLIPLLLVAVLAAPWGAAFPYAMAALPAGDGIRVRVRRAYGWNAVGAAVGGLGAGLVLLPAVGEWGTLAVCGLAEVFAVAGAVILDRARGGPRSVGADRDPGLDPASSDPSGGPHSVGADPAVWGPPPSWDGAGPRTDLLAGAFLLASGLVTIYWEVLWARILVLVVGATTYSFAAIASSVVLGIGVGSLVAGGRRLERHAGWILPSATALLLAAGIFAVPLLPAAYLAGVRTLGLSPLVAGTLGAGLLTFLPNFLLGSLFPWALAPRLAAAGTGYAINCGGSLVGAFLAGPIAASLLSLEDSYRAGVGLLASLAVLGAALRGSGERGPPGRPLAPPGARRHWGGVVGVGVLAGGLMAGGVVAAGLRLVTGPRPWDPELLLSGVYQWSRDDLETLSLQDAFASREILGIFPGREVIVTVEVDRAANTVYVRGNGKAEGSVPADPSRPSLADLPTQLILGAVPTWLLAPATRVDGFRADGFRVDGLRADGLREDAVRAGGLRPDGGPTRVLLVGIGSGVTLGALARGAGLAGPAGGPDGPTFGVDVVEIEEAFLRAVRSRVARPYLAPFVPQEILAPEGPENVTYHFADARRLLDSGLRGRRWDAIVSQPSEPWIPGSAALFTLEFFQTAARRLTPDGTFVQWLQLYKIDPDSVRVIVRTFRRVFPEVTIFRPPATGELILVGTRRPLDLLRLLAAPVEPWLLGGGAGLEVPADRLAIILVGPRGVDRWVGTGPGLAVNTDARGDIAYRAARSLYRDGDLARKNLAILRALGAEDPVTRYLPAPWRDDPELRRLLARRNLRVGDVEEARAILAGDGSAEAREILAEAERAAQSRP